MFAGFDTNLLPWRLDETLGLRAPDEGVGYVNGFVLATGVRDELEWDAKCYDPDPFVEAFGEPFEAYWNQPLGTARIGRLGLEQYRAIRDIEQADEVATGRGDDEIVAGYDRYQSEHRGQLLLFSNDRNFVERAAAHTMPAQWVDLPTDVPRRSAVSWRELEYLLYTLTVLFGVLTLPAVDLYGVWRGKEGMDWQRERVRVACRSPIVQSQLRADLSIVESYEELPIR